MRCVVSSFAAFTLLLAVGAESWGDDAACEQAEAVAQIQRLGGRVEHLVLSDHITDAGLPRLEGLRRLEHLNFGQSKVTERGIRHLRNALPECSIWYVNGGIEKWR